MKKKFVRIKLVITKFVITKLQDQDLQELFRMCPKLHNGKHFINEVIYNKEKDILIYDRKLKDGPGNNMYGLEVCKSLSLPEDFINRAYEIRMKYNPQYNNILSLKTSHYNSKKIMGMCEQCGENIGTEVHHLQHQRDANNEGVINKQHTSFHKNKLANLITLCDKCHDIIHKLDVNGSKKTKTSSGYVLQSL